MKEQHLKTAVKILKDIHYITIASVCEDGAPWNSPVSASFDNELSFFWGSSSENIHSKNIRRDGRVFVVIYDSTVPEGTGEGIYMSGFASELDLEFGGAVKRYRFVPEKIWINDEAKNDDGSYRHDIRLEIDISALKKAIV